MRNAQHRKWLFPMAALLHVALLIPKPSLLLAALLSTLRYAVRPGHPPLDKTFPFFGE